MLLAKYGVLKWRIRTTGIGKEPCFLLGKVRLEERFRETRLPRVAHGIPSRAASVSLVSRTGLPRMAVASIKKVSNAVLVFAGSEENVIFAPNFVQPW